MITISTIRTAILIIGWTAAPIAAQQQSTLPSNPTPQIKVETNPDSEGIYHASKEVTAPKLLYSVSPEFSEQSRKRKLTGATTVKFIVNADGTVRDPHVTKSAADRFTNNKDRAAAASLDEKALQAVSQYRFEPARFQGKPVPCWLTAEVDFQVF
jgi:periplasmic protein TonB